MTQSKLAKTLIIALILLTSGLALTTPAGALTTEDYQVDEAPFREVALSANRTIVDLGDDAVTSALSLGFTTKFFNRNSNEFWIGSNGFVTLHFLTGPGCCEGRPLPQQGDPDGIIAGFWTDLVPGPGSISFERVTLEDGAAVVVDYRDIPVKNAGGANATFQIVIHETGVLEINIRHAAAGGRTASIGAENIDGTRGIELSRGNATVLDNTRFLFTPIPQPPGPPPFVTGFNPSRAQTNEVVTVFGGNFDLDDATVLLGGNPVPTFIQDSATAFFIAPSGFPEGLFTVAVRNGDGSTATAPDLFEVLPSLRLDFVDPPRARQADVIQLFGSGFTSGTTVFIGSALFEPRNVAGSSMTVDIPADFPLGLYDVKVFDSGKGIERTLFRGLTVLGRPDVRVEDLTVAKPHLSALGLPVRLESAGDLTIHAKLANRGDLVAEAVEVEFRYREAAGAAREVASEWRTLAFEQLPLPKGAERTVSARLRESTTVGDLEFLAIATVLCCVEDRDPSNNFRSTRDSRYIAGLGGFSSSAIPCCPDPTLRFEHRDIVSDERDQVDSHTSTNLSLAASMSEPAFSFDNFPIVFRTSTTQPGGGFTECTTWRFLGGASGTFTVNMSLGNGIEGFTSVVAALSAATGTHRRTTHEEIVLMTPVNDIVLYEGERNTTTGNATPVTNYEFGDTVDDHTAWTLTATGLTGDFTQCSERPESGPGTERFSFAALPVEINDLRPNFSGAGQAQTVKVRLTMDRTETTANPVQPGSVTP